MRSPDFRVISSWGLLVAAGALMTGCVYEVPDYPPPRTREVVVEKEVPAPAPAREVVVEKEVPAPEPAREVVVEKEVPASDVEVETIYVDEVHRGPIHEYYYYPGEEVYFDPVASSWFWFEGGVWRAGVALPPHIHVVASDRICLRTDALRPFAVHDRFRQRVYAYRHDRHFSDHRGPDRFDHGGPGRYDHGGPGRYDHGGPDRSYHGGPDRYDNRRGDPRRDSGWRH